jgi:hypothetical protein
VNLKIKHEEGSDYMDSIATTTVKQNRLIEMIGSTGPKQTRKTHNVLPTSKDKKCHFGFNVICRSTDGAFFIQKCIKKRAYLSSTRSKFLDQYNQHGRCNKGTYPELFKSQCYSQYGNQIGSSRAWREVLRKTNGAHFEQAKGVVCDDDIIHPEKQRPEIFWKSLMLCQTTVT